MGKSDKAEQSPARLAVADHYAHKRRWEQADRQYEAVIQADAGRPLASRAKLGLAQSLGAQGQEEKMVELLKEVATLAPARIGDGPKDTDDTRNRAYQALGQHYMAKREWREALGWWERWQPTSWCATCAEGMRKTRAANIELCRKNLQSE